MSWMILLTSLFAGLAGFLLCSEHITGLNVASARHWLLQADQPHHHDAPGGEWDILRHLGGISPWIQKVHGTVEGGIETPAGCRVDQIHMISRHAERYPTVLAGIKMLELYHRVKSVNITLDGDLAFLNHWEFLTLDPRTQFETLVSTGPYAGTLEAFATGVKLRTRYKDLLDNSTDHGKTSFWASDSKRVVDTARYFAAGFFGIDWQDLATLHIIPETAEAAADTLTPGRTCLNYARNVDDFGHDLGSRKLFQWRSVYIPPIIERLGRQNPGLAFTESEVYTMQELCGFETIAKGSSQWCNVFSQAEMEDFEYARDLLHYYKAGPGNPYSATMGWLWLNATANLLREGSPMGQMFFSFVHDGDINPLLTALELPPRDRDLPTYEILQDRTWRISDVVPMGGRLIFERLACPASQLCWSNAPLYPNHISCDPVQDDIFVRLNVNDGITPIPGCETGPGRSCPLEDFLKRVKKRGEDVGVFGEEVGDFGSVCGLAEDAAKRITFLHQ